MKKINILIFLLLCIAYVTKLTADVWIQSSSNDFAQGQFSDIQITGTGTNAYLELLNYWSNMNPIVKPSARSYHSMVYDSSNRQIILFGGYPGPNNETWVYNLTINKWSNMNPQIKPLERQEHAMVYDSENKKVVLIGGNLSSGAPILNGDTWVYDLANNKWTNMSPFGKPTDRRLHAMVYDSLNKITILFGGNNSSGINGETWIYNFSINSWISNYYGNTPSPRNALGIVYDSSNRQIILFGGSPGPVHSDDTWVFNFTNNIWTNMNPLTKPSARACHAMAYDSFNQKVILFGGKVGVPINDETWIYNPSENSWMQKYPFKKPSARWHHSMTYDLANNRIVLFGGMNGGVNDETWIYETRNSGIFESYWFDTGAPSIFSNISWNMSMPTGATCTFQIATSSSSNDPWNFKGPDGNFTTYYTNSNQQIWQGHNGDRYIKYKTYFNTECVYDSPQLNDVSIVYENMPYRGLDTNAPWPMFRQNVRHTGWTNKNVFGVQKNPVAKWSFATVGGVSSSSAIGPDGTIYVGSWDSKLYAITNGAMKWSFTTGDGIQSSPAIGSDGTIYVGSRDNKLYAITNGVEKWSFSAGDNIDSSPAIGSDGAIYVGSDDNKLYAITNGAMKWSFTTGGKIFSSSPAIGSDGTIYVGSLDNKLYAITNGAIKWSFTTGGDVYSSPAIGVDNTIYVGSLDYKLYAITNGAMKWSFTTEGDVFTSPAIGLDGTIYVGSGDNKLYAITNGVEKWTFAAGNWRWSSPAIGLDGTIYAGNGDNKLYAITNGVEKWSFSAGGDIDSSPAIGSDGTIYMGSWDNKLYAIKQNNEPEIVWSGNPEYINDGIEPDNGTDG